MSDRWRRWRDYMDEVEDLLRWMAAEFDRAEQDAAVQFEVNTWPPQQRRKRLREVARRMGDMPFFGELLRANAGIDPANIPLARDSGLSKHPVEPMDPNPMPVPGQGEIPAAVPRGAELRAVLQGTWLPRIEALVAAFERPGPDFSWSIPMGDLNMHPLAGGLPRRPGSHYELDHGDLQALAAAGNLLIAQARFVLAYDDADVDPDDFDFGDNPMLDPLAVIDGHPVRKAPITVAVPTMPTTMLKAWRA